MNTDDFDKRLKDMLSAGMDDSQVDYDSMLKETIAMYTTKTKRAAYLTWATLAICLGLILCCLALLAHTDNIKTMLYMVLVILVLHEVTILMKLWWWTYSSRNVMMETLKTIQLQLSKLEKANT